LKLFILTPYKDQLIGATAFQLVMAGLVPAISLYEGKAVRR
jgi:hypothetical protein